MAIFLSELEGTDRKFIDQLLYDKQWALDYYDARDLEFDRCEHWYFKDHYNVEAEVPSGSVMDENTDENEHYVTVPIATNIVNSVHGIFTDEDFYVQCLSTTGRRDQERANKVERLLHGTYWINRQTQGGDAIEDAVQDALIYGWGVIYSYWDTDRAAMSRDSKGRPKDVMDFYSYPLVVRRIHPKDIRPIIGGVRERWKGVVYNVMRTKREIEEEWGVEIMPLPSMDADGNDIYEDLQDDTLMEYTDYWVWRRDKQPDTPGVPMGWQLWHCIIAHEQVIKYPTPMPEYEFLPYEIFFCRKSPSDSGSRMGLSFLYTIIEPVQELEYNINRMSRMVDMYSDPMLVVIGSADGIDQDIEKGPGTTIYVESGGDAKYVSWNGNAPDMQHLIRFWKDAAQDSFPPIMGGMEGGTSGLDTVALQSGGKLQTNKPRRNLELAVQRVNTKLIRLFQQFSMDDPIFVMGQRTEEDEEIPFAFSIKGKETKGYEATIVTVRGRFPQEELRNVVAAGNVVGAGLMSAREAAGKYLYTQNPDRSFRMWLEEQTMKDPQWRMFFQQLYFQLPARSPVGEALSEVEGVGPTQPDQVSAADMAGGDLAAALATNQSEVQSGVQRTPIESNIFSGLMGGIPSGQ